MKRDINENHKYPLSKERMATTMTEAADRFGDVPYVAISDDGRVDGFFAIRIIMKPKRVCSSL